jgi:ATP-binding cassette subfamily B protein
MPDNKTPQPAPPSVFVLLKPYKLTVFWLALLAVGMNGFNLALPKILSHGIDAFIRQQSIDRYIVYFSLVTAAIFIFGYLQALVQTYVSERVARDTRSRLSAKISQQSNTFIQKVTAGKLLTNLTSDIDSIKLFVAQAIVQLISSAVLIIGASIILLTIDWKLALAVLTIIPIIGGTFFFVLQKVRVLFFKSREVIDWLNKVINESILGAALIRVLNSQQPEYNKFLAANSGARDLGLQILKLFASLIPIITFVANAAILVILALGGRFVINGDMTLGDFTAFNSYVGILIFPILIIGFMSNVIAQASASYQRIAEVLEASDMVETGSITSELQGQVELKNVTLSYGEKPALKNVSLSVPAHSRTAIIGPTAAGKTQLLYLLTALNEPDSGKILYDGKNIKDYNRAALYRQVGFVFQDSIMFNLTIRENIAFNVTVSDDDMGRAIKAAELSDFIDTLPDKLETVVSERGTSLSGGQKQRIMLARALALNPKILLLDDFTARVDTRTEQRILANVAELYPNITLISVTQKISSVEHYDQIILLMEGEVLASGTHPQLMESSPEYVQIYNSQRSTSHYELQT